MKTKKIVLGILVFVEVILIGYVSIEIYEKQQNKPPYTEEVNLCRGDEVCAD